MTTKVIIAQLKQLANCINEKLQKIADKSQSLSDERLRETLVELCTLIVKNSVEFKTRLKPENHETENFVITLNLVDLIGEEECRKLKQDVLQKFKEYLELFSKNFLLSSRDPVFVNLCDLFCSEINTDVENHQESKELPDSGNAKSAVEEFFSGNDQVEVSNTLKASIQETQIPRNATESLKKNTVNDNTKETNLVKNSVNILDNIVVNYPKVSNVEKSIEETRDVVNEENKEKTIECDTSNKNTENLAGEEEKSKIDSEKSGNNLEEKTNKEDSSESIESALDRNNECTESDNEEINRSSSIEKTSDESIRQNETLESTNRNIEDSDIRKDFVDIPTEINSPSPSVSVSQSNNNNKFVSERSSGEESEIFNVSGTSIVPTDKNEDNLASLNSQKSVSGLDESIVDKTTFLNAVNLMKKPVNDVIATIRDELYDILIENDYREEENELEEISNLDNSSEDEEEKYTESAAALALKELDEDSFSFTESSSSVSELEMSICSNLSDEGSHSESDNRNEKDLSINEFVPKNCKVILERKDLQKLKMEFNSGQNSDESQFKLRSCSVLLEPIKMNEDESSSEEDSRVGYPNEDAEIDRICQLPTFGKKRKLEEHKRRRKKIKRKRTPLSKSGSETSDLSEYSSISDGQIELDRKLEDEDDSDTPTDPNTLLMEIMCHIVHDSNSDSSVCNFSDRKDDKTRENKKDNNNENYSKRSTDKESWRNDPLLRGNLNLPTDRKEKKKNGPVRIRTSESSTDSESVRIRKKRRSTFLDSDDSDSSGQHSSDSLPDAKENTKQSHEGSEIEFVGTTDGVIDLDSNDDCDKKGGRRKIRSLLSSKDLTESTQRAAEEEQERIKNLEEQRHLISSQEAIDSEDKSRILDISKDDSKILIDKELWKKLFPHQIEGIKFMWEACYMSIDRLDTFQGTGCILAHNMGLGKTMQVVTLVHTLFNYPNTKTKHVLVVCPLSTVYGWKKEFVNALKIAKSMKNINITTIESKYSSQLKREYVRRWKRSGGVLILGYEAFCKLTHSNQCEEMRTALLDPGPDLVVCDEAHLLKNKNSLRTRSLMEIKTKRRIALTGTPLQNNLNEYYYMVQFVKPNLLGTKNEFSRQFVNPIMNGQYEDSGQADITLMKKRTSVLHRLLKNTVQRYESTELEKYLDNIMDYTLFIQLHPVQERLYRKYIEMVKPENLTKKAMNSFFTDYQILKFICSHPQLLQTMETQKNKNIKEKEVISQEPEISGREGVPHDWWLSECNDEVQTNIDFGTKLQIMLGIIEEAEKKKEKVLIFTSSLVELNSIEYFLKLKGTSGCSSWKSKRDYFRMDGTVTPSIRTYMCEEFNNKSNDKLRLFLMSHKVGGLGLNLVGANRVILLGVNFNPSHDSQSIYRAYRFGQDKPVYIYRLISMGTMEEKIYHRCVTKLAIASRVVDKHQIARHYKNLDLEDLYNVDIDLNKERSKLAKPDDDILSAILIKFPCVHKYLHHRKLLENQPDEELNEEEQRKAWEEFEEMIKREKDAAYKPMAINNILQGVCEKIMIPGAVLNKGPINPSLNQNSSIYPELPNISGMPPSMNRTQPPSVQSSSSQQSRRSMPELKKFSTQPPKLIHVGPTTNFKTIRNRKEKPKSSTIGPNPLFFNSFVQGRDKATTSNWRTTSSDDFQKSTARSNVVKRKKAPDEQSIVDQNVIDITDEEFRDTMRNKINEIVKVQNLKGKTVDCPPVIDIT